MPRQEMEERTYVSIYSADTLSKNRILARSNFGVIMLHLLAKSFG